MAANDYTTVGDVKQYLSGASSLQSTQDDTLLGDLITRLSAFFDRLTGHRTGYFAANPAAVRHYSGQGDAFVDIDEFDSVAQVRQWISPDMAGVVTMVSDNPDSQFYYTLHPIDGPPYTRIFTFNGWYPDVYNVGNVEVTGKVSTPPPIEHAITVWVAHEYKGRAANWADMASRPDGPGYFYKKGVPAEVQLAVDQYTITLDEGANIALVDGSVDYEPGRYHWAGWRTFEVP